MGRSRIVLETMEARRVNGGAWCTWDGYPSSGAAIASGGVCLILGLALGVGYATTNR